MSKLKLPKKVRIGSLTYKIKYVMPGKGTELLDGETGCINQERQLIEIDKTISDEMLLLVLVHEILHGVGDAMSPNKSPFTKESFTCTVAELLTHALSSAGLLPNALTGSRLPHLGRRKVRR